MLTFLLSYLLVYKYTILFCVITGASFGIPLPATALIMAAGAFAAQGYLSFSDIFFYWLLASVFGDTLGYIISLRYGREIFIRMGLGKIFLSPKFTVIENLFTKYSAMTIFSSRFLATTMGPVINILSGVTKIHYKKFLLYDILGECCYVLLYGGLGYVFGDQWEAISQISGDIASIIVLIVILIVLFIIALRRKNGQI